MTTCCGTTHTTQFCPNCGKSLVSDGTIQSLLVHCRAQMGHRERLLRAHEEWCKEHGADRALPQAQKIFDKWQGWVTALEDVLKTSHANNVSDEE